MFKFICISRLRNYITDMNLCKHSNYMRWRLGGMLLLIIRSGLSCQTLFSLEGLDMRREERGPIYLSCLHSVPF